MNQVLHICGGRVVDPSTGRDEIADVWVAGDTVVDPPAGNVTPVRDVDARGCIVAPGFVDIHVHFREPGNDEAETIATGSDSAARGGFASVVPMPNTRPPTDTPERISWAILRAGQHGAVRLMPSGCITSDREGADLADLAGMARAGAVAFTDDGSTVADEALLEAAMRVAAKLGLPVLDHAMDPALAGDGVMHEGRTSSLYGVPGVPSAAEEVAVRRDVLLAEKTGCRMHIQHVSTREGVALIREARARGVPVSGEATPHHLRLVAADVPRDNANFKMNPPLCDEADREALLEAVADGTLHVLATDHAPHSAASKAAGLLAAPFGVVGLETAIGLTYSDLVLPGRMSVGEWVRRWTVGPCEVLGTAPPSLAPGATADVTIIDASTSWRVNPEEFASRSRNTPFGGAELTGRAIMTIRAGDVTWDGCSV